MFPYIYTYMCIYIHTYICVYIYTQNVLHLDFFKKNNKLHLTLSSIYISPYRSSLCFLKPLDIPYYACNLGGLKKQVTHNLVETVKRIQRFINWEEQPWDWLDSAINTIIKNLFLSLCLGFSGISSILGWLLSWWKQIDIQRLGFTSKVTLLRTIKYENAWFSSSSPMPDLSLKHKHVVIAYC